MKNLDKKFIFELTEEEIKALAQALSHVHYVGEFCPNKPIGKASRILRRVHKLISSIDFVEKNRISA